MKKILIATSLAGLLSASAISDKAMEFVKKVINNDSVNVELVSANPIKDTGFEMVEFNIIQNNQVLGSDILFSNGTVVTPSLFDLNKNIDYKADFIQKKELEKRNQIIKQIPDFVKKNNNIAIKLGNHKSEYATVVFSDPDCPFCRKHLDMLEAELKNNNVIFILTPLPMHKDALIKSTLILKELPNAKTDAQKLALLKKYFADVNLPTITEDIKKNSASYEMIVEEIFKMGINATPSVFENVQIK